MTHWSRFTLISESLKQSNLFARRVNYPFATLFILFGLFTNAFAADPAFSIPVPVEQMKNIPLMARQKNIPLNFHQKNILLSFRQKNMPALWSDQELSVVSSLLPTDSTVHTQEIERDTVVSSVLSPDSTVRTQEIERDIVRTLKMELDIPIQDQDIVRTQKMERIIVIAPDANPGFYYEGTRIFALAITASFSLRLVDSVGNFKPDDPSAFVRVVLVDRDSGFEYLVFQKNYQSLTTEEYNTPTTLTVSNTCQETCVLPVPPDVTGRHDVVLRLEARHAGITVHNISYVDTPIPKDFWIERPRYKQQNAVLIKELNERNLGWFKKLNERKQNAVLIKELNERNLGWIKKLNEPEQDLGWFKTLKEQNSSWFKKLNEREQDLDWFKALREQDLGWIAGETSVSNLSYEEKKRLVNLTDPDQKLNLQGFEYYSSGVFELKSRDAAVNLVGTPASNLVDSFDWTNRHGKDWVTSVKNQNSSCGSCWAFASVGAMEAVANLYFNQHLDLDLSEQDVLSCSGQGTCDGGSPFKPSIFTSAIVDESSFKYKAKDLSCSMKPAISNEKFSAANLSKPLNNQSDDEIKRLLIEKGPLVATIRSIRHAMTLVGFETAPEDERTIWIFKNSWGQDWGHNVLENKGGFANVKLEPNDLMVAALETPINSLVKTRRINCVDKDNDTYCNWGVSRDKPATCPASCKAEKDCDDSDAKKGPFDARYNCPIQQ